MSDNLNGSAGPSPSFDLLPVSSAIAQTPARQVSLAHVIADQAAIAGLLELLLQKSGLSINECARRMGVHPGSIRQYVNSRRTQPSVQWLTKMVQACGGKVVVELPTRPL